MRSARFAGEEASDEENVEKLLGELAGVALAGRTARYVCELVLVSPEGEEHRGTGHAGGRDRSSSGAESGGFGYDPVFVPDGASAHGRRAGRRVEGGREPPRLERRDRWSPRCRRRHRTTAGRQGVC